MGLLPLEDVVTLAAGKISGLLSFVAPDAFKFLIRTQNQSSKPNSSYQSPSQGSEASMKRASSTGHIVGPVMEGKFKKTGSSDQMVPAVHSLAITPPVTPPLSPSKAPGALNRSASVDILGGHLFIPKGPVCR